MSSLDKLAIRGIRSFDHNDLSVIQFYNPLTVIVGHNGSGKTTIIECLKYATTGDLPPNTKGGAFVHDPSIAGTSEVRAQVKLRFNNSRQEKMLVERRLQVTKKKTGGGLTMKTLEGVISFADEEKNSKKRTSLSTKCAALDEEVPKQLGVSKAILENVIFCHQEESNWPLSEPAALKKKFDDIFEATKYTKALDQIKTLRKEQAVEIKVDKEKLAALKIDRDRAVKLRSTIDKLAATIAVKDADHEQLDDEIRRVSEENVTFFTQASKYQSIINKADTLKTQRSIVEQNNNRARASLKELKDTDEELGKKIESHKETMDASKVEVDGARRTMQNEEDDQETAERKRSAAQTSHGQHLAVKQRYLDNLENRQVLIKEIAARHSIAGYDHDMSDAEMNEFEEKLSELMTAQQRKIQAIKAEAQDADRKRDAIISEMKLARNSDEQAKNSVTNQINAANSRVREMNRKLEQSTTSVADVTYAESTLAEEKRRKKELEDSVKETNYPEKIRQKTVEHRTLDDEREQLHTELTSLNTQANVRAKLALKRTENERKEQAIQSLLDKSAAAFKRYTKVEPMRDTMEAEVNAVYKGVEQDISAADRALKEASKELSTVETSVSITSTKVKELKASSLKLKTKITDTLKNLDMDKPTVELCIAEAEEEVAFARTHYQELEGFIKFFDILLKKGKKEKLCFGCNRHLDKNEAVSFEAYCQSKKDQAPDQLESAKSELSAWEKQLQDLRALLPTEVAYNKLFIDDIPAAEKSAETYSARLPNASAKAQEANQKLAELKAQQQELQLLRKSATDVVRMNRECDEIARDIAKLESELSASGSTATSEDIQDKLAAIGEKLRAVTQATEKLRSDSGKQTSTIHALANSIHSAEMQLNRKQQELKDKEALETRKEGTQAEIVTLEAESRDLEKKIRDSLAPLRKAQDEATEARRTSTLQESVAARELSGYNKSSEQLDVNAKEIKSYVTRGGEQLLTKCEGELKQHEKVVAEKKKTVAQLQQKISALEKMIGEANNVLRNYEDNVSLRAGRRQIQDLDDQIAALDVGAAEKAHRKYDAEYNEKRQKQSNLQAHQAKLGGEIETMKTDLADKRSELKSEYDSIDDKYKIELIKVKTAEVANLDLEKYGKALDNAIMQFHGHKMREINDTITDLWTKTYQGTDIDKIMIKSDAEGKGAGGRSYNYRVVMQKDNTEMDMRGRCSAGQKVLASIIIRLALAESFGTDCGIMALDEPTTNLDQDNIKALASALSELIKDRHSQSNFQLVVITHDEQFLETLGGNGVLTKYWRVSRGDGGQVSKVERQSLT